MESVVIIDFTKDQEKTVNMAFIAEYLKDELIIKKQFSDYYDFDFDDEMD